jgi:DNA-binding SARP family transcriptional activator
MGRLEFTLLGRFEARRNGRSISTGPEPRKPVELLCYLLVFDERPHHRELLADQLWAGSTTSQSRKYLRQALWQLQRLFGLPAVQPDPLLILDHEWIQLNARADRWLDIDEVERAYARVKGTPGEDMDRGQVHCVRDAVSLYRADLLEGWYQDWVVFERERLKTMYLAMLERLLAYSERRREVEDGLRYGGLILQHDRAHERTHWRMMRLHSLAGDRTGAMRQFNRCVAALDEELGVKPSDRTLRLHERIRDDLPIDEGDGTPRTPRPEPTLPRHDAKTGGADDSTERHRGAGSIRLSGQLANIQQTVARVERLVEQDLEMTRVISRRDRRDRPPRSHPA